MGPVPKSKRLLVTHNGSFHTDDIFACAALAIMLERAGEQFEIIRTRDEVIIKTGDYVFDVGGVYDETANRFDHHQVGGAGKGESGIEYSSFGLVWHKFGADLCGSKKAASTVDNKLVTPIDAHDNGFDLTIPSSFNKNKIYPYTIQNLFFSMYPTWQETQEMDFNYDEAFMKAVLIAKDVLSREIIQAQDLLLAEELVSTIYKNTIDKRIIVLDKNYPYEYILNNFPEPLFVVYPRVADNSWGAKAITEDYRIFKNRKDFPVNWGGLRNEELQTITGVPDAIFCHRALFMIVAKSREGAISLAQKALEPSN